LHRFIAGVRSMLAALLPMLACATAASAGPLSAGGFMPHGMCFQWRPGILTLHVVSDALIAVAYFSIPGLLLWFVRRRPDMPFGGVLWMFAIFIVSCGLTHVLSIWVIWHPAYWLEGAVKGITAVSSIATALLLVPLLPRALALRSPVELDVINGQLAATLAESKVLLARYEREQHIAAAFQNASLPSIPARIGTLAISALYRPGTSEMEIGGDWYDAFRLPDGRVIVSIGDVMGKGLAASVIMSKMRQAIRTAAQIHVESAAMLDAADKSLRMENPEAIVTAFIGIIDEVEHCLRYANAGHPPPYVRAPDGNVHVLPGTGLPLGLRLREESADSNCIELQAGSMLVLYTDGLTESTHDFAEGERRLLAALQDQAVELAPEPAREIGNAVLGAAGRDDVAILTVRVGSSAGVGNRWTFDVGDPGAAAAARAGISAYLAARHASAQELRDAELIYGELIGNALRYAGGTVDVRLDWQSTAPVLHVLDDGPGFLYIPRYPTDLLAEAGRGLFIVSRLVDELTILPRSPGGTHARAVLAIGHRARSFATGARAFA